MRCALAARLGVIGLLAVASMARAEPRRIAFDGARSHAEFQVRVMWLFSVEGRFGAVEGELEVDDAARVARVDAQIDATRVKMRSSDYEDWVKSPEFFDAASHPRLGFRSEPFPLSVLHDGGDILGTLTVRGVTHPVSFSLRGADCAQQPGIACPVQAEGSIQRSDFGMRTHRGTLADRVRLHFTVYATAPPPD